MEHKHVLGPGPRTTVKRHADRARYDAASVHAIIDEALVCHVSFVIDGQPFALPTAHARIDDAIYLHGALANHMFRTLAQGARACLAFTLVDGLVMARNAFHHSMNYRSAVVFGAGQEVMDLEEKRRALTALVDHAQAGRSAECIAPTVDELKATLVVRVSIEEAAAKVRNGPVIDSPAHVAADPCWAGVIPLKLSASDPVRDGRSSFERVVSPVVSAAVNARGGRAPIERVEDGLLYSSDKTRLDLPMIHGFLRDESYWAQGVELWRVQKSIESSLCFGVYRNGAQLGYARVLVDGGRFAYLGDVFVLASERGKGVGKRLVDFVLSHPEVAAVDRILLGTRDAHSLYGRYGFVPAPPDRYMVRLRSDGSTGSPKV